MNANQIKDIFKDSDNIDNFFYRVIRDMTGSKVMNLLSIIKDNQEENLKDYICENYKMNELYDNDSIIEYINDSNEPEEVFEEEDLVEAVIRCNPNTDKIKRIIDNTDTEISQLYTSSEICQYVTENLSIEDVFSKDEIVLWVTDNLNIDEAFDDDEIEDYYNKNIKEN